MNGFKKVLFYANEYKQKYYVSIYLIFGSVLMEVILYLFAYHLISKFLSGGEITLYYVLGISVAIGLSLIIKNYLYGRGLVASHEVAYDTLMGMRIHFAGKMLKTPLGRIQMSGIGAYKKNFINDIDHLEVLLAHLIPEGLPYLMSPIVVFLVLLVIDWRMALLSLASIPFGLIAMGLMMSSGMKKMEPFYKAEQRMNKTIVEYIAGMEVIKIFNRAINSYEKYKEDIYAYRDYTLDWYKESWTYMAIYTAVLPCTILLMLPVGLSFFLNGTLELSTYIFSLMITLSIGTSLVKLMELIPNFPQLSYKISELEKAFEGSELKFNDQGKHVQNYKVEYSEITFAYADKDVLKNVCFTAEENAVTAIVGESGSGKSTLAKLLVKFWDAQKGTITIGGVNIDELSIERLNDLVSFVAQDTFLFDIPIIENIRLGKPTATDEDVYEAAKAAQCHDFISRLSKGYQTRPGESGDKLSGGEKQRITIARAILKDAPIIILDEATSSTDSENEDLIQEALNCLIQKKTLIVIAHRLSTIVDANHIVVMDAGKICEQGTHQELLKTSAKYNDLWRAHIQSTHWGIQIHEELEAHEYA